jgi:hypothetical protein
MCGSIPEPYAWGGNAKVTATYLYASLTFEHAGFGSGSNHTILTNDTANLNSQTTLLGADIAVIVNPDSTNAVGSKRTSPFRRLLRARPHSHYEVSLIPKKPYARRRSNLPPSQKRA